MTSATLDTHPAQPPTRVTRYGVPLNGTQEQKLIAAIRSTNREVERLPGGGYRVADLKQFTPAADLAALAQLASAYGLSPNEPATAPEHAFGAQRDSGKPN